MLIDSKNAKLREILDRLRRLKLESTESSLDRAIDEEAEALLGYAMRGKQRRTRMAWKAALEAAEDNYAELLDIYLATKQPAITPSDVLNYRCRATAWAVAMRILDAERGGQPQ